MILTDLSYYSLKKKRILKLKDQSSSDCRKKASQFKIDPTITNMVGNMDNILSFHSVYIHES